MDIVDQRTNPPTAYTNDTIPFSGDNRTFFYGHYGRDGDSLYDIWVSRINAVYLYNLREGQNDKDEYWIYNDYLNRVVDRMREPANVPSRGFVMGGAEDHASWGITVDLTLGCMRNLNLPWTAIFDGPEQNSPFNWMSQLLAGPMGTITYGSFNGTLFPAAENERNRRYCRNYLLNNVYLAGDTMPGVVWVSNDSLGWEWAGVYNHSFPGGSDFWSGYYSSTYYCYNGGFGYGTLGQPITLSNRMTDGGYLGEYYRYYTDPDEPNPYNMTMGTKGKMAVWRWPVNTDGDSAKKFDVYLSYVPSPANDQHVGVTLQEASMNANGVAFHGVDTTQKIRWIGYDQTDSTNDLPQQYRATYPGWWHRVKFNPDTVHWDSCYVTLRQDNIAIVSVDFCHDETTPVYRIADAVLFISLDGTVVEAVDDSEPTTYSEQDNSSHQIFSTRGFAFNNYYCRNYEDMGDEPGGGGLAKPQFYMMCACEINKYNEEKNIGTMYALGHNGLINLGAAGPDYANQTIRTPFIEGLSIGMDFGQAFIYALNQRAGWPNPRDEYYNLLGAGSLRAQPYIQFGSTVLERMTVSGSRTDNTNNPVLIQHLTATGDWDVTSTHDGSSPFGTHGEIIIRPETTISPTGSNEVILRAY